MEILVHYLPQTKSNISEGGEWELISIPGKPVVKKLVKATGAENYNVLQNNGRIAHQEVDHVHFHMVRLLTSPFPIALFLGYDGCLFWGEGGAEVL